MGNDAELSQEKQKALDSFQQLLVAFGANNADFDKFVGADGSINGKELFLSLFDTFFPDGEMRGLFEPLLRKSNHEEFIDSFCHDLTSKTLAKYNADPNGALNIGDVLVENAQAAIAAGSITFETPNEQAKFLEALKKEATKADAEGVKPADIVKRFELIAKNKGAEFHKDPVAPALVPADATPVPVSPGTAVPVPADATAQTADYVVESTGRGIEVTAPDGAVHTMSAFNLKDGLGQLGFTPEQIEQVSKMDGAGSMTITVDTANQKPLIREPIQATQDAIEPLSGDFEILKGRGGYQILHEDGKLQTVPMANAEQDLTALGFTPEQIEEITTNDGTTKVTIGATQGNTPVPVPVSGNFDVVRNEEGYRLARPDGKIENFPFTVAEDEFKRLGFTDEQLARVEEMEIGSSATIPAQSAQTVDAPEYTVTTTLSDADIQQHGYRLGNEVSVTDAQYGEEEITAYGFDEHGDIVEVGTVSAEELGENGKLQTVSLDDGMNVAFHYEPEGGGQGYMIPIGNDWSIEIDRKMAKELQAPPPPPLAPTVTDPAVIAQNEQRMQNSMQDMQLKIGGN